MSPEQSAGLFTYLQCLWNGSDMVEQYAVEGTIHAIIDIVHKRRSASTQSVPTYPLTNDIHSNCMGGAREVATFQEINKETIIDKRINRI